MFIKSDFIKKAQEEIYNAYYENVDLGCIGNLSGLELDALEEELDDAESRFLDFQRSLCAMRGAHTLVNDCCGKPSHMYCHYCLDRPHLKWDK